MDGMGRPEARSATEWSPTGAARVGPASSFLSVSAACDTCVEQGVTHRVRVSVRHIDRDTSHNERANLRCTALAISRA
jgi:hypothetical protein